MNEANISAVSGEKQMVISYDVARQNAGKINEILSEHAFHNGAYFAANGDPFFDLVLYAEPCPERKLTLFDTAAVSLQFEQQYNLRVSLITPCDYAKRQISQILPLPNCDEPCLLAPFPFGKPHNKGPNTRAPVHFPEHADALDDGPSQHAKAPGRGFLKDC